MEKDEEENLEEEGNLDEEQMQEVMDNLLEKIYEVWEVDF
jgi:hypothetical protein